MIYSDNIDPICFFRLRIAGGDMLEVRLLGQFEVRLDGKPVPISTRNAQSLLAYLILHPGNAFRREKLAGMLWPDSSEENARSNLRHEIWRLRKALDPQAERYLLMDELTIAFNPRGEFSLDVQRLESPPLESCTAAELSAALAAYQGELLPGFYDEWVDAERDRVLGLFEARMERLLDILQGEGRWTDALDWAARWTALGQWPEPACRALMSAYASTGDLAKAAATYERFSQGLQKELGVSLSEQTQELYRRLKTGWRPGKAEDAALRAAPPSKPAPGAAPQSFPFPRVRRSNLPRPLTSFIGREKELQQVENLVSRARLVTITGSGGVGKTRLAIQAAGLLAPQFADGVWWVELASLSPTSPSPRVEPATLPGPALAQAGVEEELGAGQVTQALAKVFRIAVTPGMSLLEAVLEALRERKLLLVLDNCEHLIEDCAFLVERVLGDCAEVSVLTTSREALGLAGEKAWRLPSLSLPERGVSGDREGILHSEAVSLFIERASDVLPGYQPGELEGPAIAQICRRLGGIPLAIELAAARMNLLSAQEIASRLDGRFNLLTGGQRTALPRQQTLRAAIEWSYDLLSALEQRLFDRLSVFAGSFTLDAAEAICAGQGIAGDEVVALLGRLVDKSLLSVEPAPRDSELATRYRFLDTIRSFGRLNLNEKGETQAMCARHAEHYVRVVEAAEPVLMAQSQTRWFKLLQAENDNLRAAIEWSAESDEAESGLRLTGALLWFWFASGSNREGRDLALKALAAPSAALHKKAHARALNTAGFLLCLLGDTAHARQLLEEAQSILRTTDGDSYLAWSLQFLGLVLAYEKEYELADAAFNEGLGITRKYMDKDPTSFLFFLGDVDLLKGDRSRAQKIYEESVDILRGIGSKSFLAYPLRRLGYLALEENNIRKAQAYFQESLALNHDVGDMPGITASLNSLAALALHTGKAADAARLYGVVEGRLERFSINLLNTDQSEFGRVNSLLPASLDEVALTDAFSEGWGMSEEEAMRYVGEVFGGGS